MPFLIALLTRVTAGKAHRQLQAQNRKKVKIPLQLEVKYKQNWRGVQKIYRSEGLSVKLHFPETARDFFCPRIHAYPAKG